MHEIFIDDTGEVWPAGPEIIIRRFGVRRPRHFVFRAIELGFIFVAVSERCLRIAFRPQFVSRSAISHLLGMIGQRSPARLALAWDDRLSSWEIITGAVWAIGRIERLITEARSPSPRPLLTAKRLPLERCRDTAGGQLLPVLQAWEQRQGRWEPGLYGRLEESGLLATTAISRQPRGSDRLLIEHWGAGITSYGEDWIRIARGRDFADQPNAELGRWDNIRQAQTLAEGVPELSKQDFVFRRTNGELVRVSFDRLGLPWRTSDGAAILTAVTTRRRMLTLERANPAN